MAWRWHQITSWAKIYGEKDRELARSVTAVVGFRPANLALYRLALRHTSAEDDSARRLNNNERLEYLGDAILGAIVAEFLFKKYPYKDEGFLTEIRSRLVNRESLNELARKIGLADLLEYDNRRKGRLTHKSMYGDALEAFVGAVYLDYGFAGCRRFVISRLIRPHFDIETVVQTDKNFKSKLIEWGQRENRRVRFGIIKEDGNQHAREFVAQVMLDDEPLATGRGYSKKKAEQAAAANACESLGVD